LQVVDLAEYEAADATETVDGYFNVAHCLLNGFVGL
jgi:hypothetical protein